MSTRREEIAAALKSLYVAEFDGVTLDSGQTVAAIYDKLIPDVEKRSPVIVIAADGTDRSGRVIPDGYAVYGASPVAYLYRVVVMVMIASRDMKPGYTASKAYEVLSEIEERVGNIHESNEELENRWRVLTQQRESNIRTVSLEDGTVYLREEIPIAIYP
jgi:hypothetical protein